MRVPCNQTSVRGRTWLASSTRRMRSGPETKRAMARSELSIPARKMEFVKGMAQELHGRVGRQRAAGAQLQCGGQDLGGDGQAIQAF